MKTERRRTLGSFVRMVGWLSLYIGTAISLIIVTVYGISVMTQLGDDEKAALNLEKDDEPEMTISVMVCEKSIVENVCWWAKPVPGAEVFIPATTGSKFVVTDNQGKVSVGLVTVPKVFLPVLDAVPTCASTPYYKTHIWRKGNQLNIHIVYTNCDD